MKINRKNRKGLIMEITATSKYDRKTATALARVGVFKRHNPKKRMILLAALIGVIVAESILMLFLLGGGFPILLLCLSAVLILIQCYVYFLLPKIQYRLLGKFAESCHTFHFTDDTVIITSSGDDYNGSCSITYHMFYQVMETGEYLFLYQNKRQVFVVDKSTVQGGTVSELRTKLANISGLRYILCKY